MKNISDQFIEKKNTFNLQ